MGDSSNFMMIWTSLLPDLEAEYATALVDIVGARYPVSPQYETLKSLCSEMPFKSGTDEIVVFAGTFNPWHSGHQACLTLLPDDKICLVAPDRNPYKELRTLDAVTTVLEVSTHGTFKKNHFLVPTFLLEHKKNPTIDWVLRFQENLPDQKLSLLMGFDSFSTLKTWTRADELLPLIDTIYVASRLEDDEDRILALDEAHALGPNLNVVFLGKHDYENVSSTEIRNKSRR